jgi:uncharacterized membrane protein (UPF0182 family)
VLKRLLQISGVGWIRAFLALVFLLLVSRWGAGFMVDALWFQVEGAARVFWTRTLSDWGVRLLSGLVAGVAVALSLRPVIRRFGNLQIRRRLGDLVIQERIPPQILRWVWRGGGILSGLWFAAAIPRGVGLTLILALVGPQTGVTDPLLGADLGFFFFRLSALSGLLTWGILLGLFVLALISGGYLASGGIRLEGNEIRTSAPVVRHLSGTLAVVVFLVSLRLVLAPHLLLSDGSSAVQGIVGAADVGARIPALRITALLTFIASAAMAWGALRGRLLPAIVGVSGVAVFSFVALWVYPGLVQRFQVQPNELTRETPHIERAVTATLDGFGLGTMTRERLAYRAPSDDDLALASDLLPQVPLWTEKTLDETFSQVEARFEYYGFGGIHFSRYPDPLEGGRQIPVALAVREVVPFGIPLEGQTWQNLHLRERYVSGIGGVAGPASRQTDEGRMPAWIAAVPPEFRAGPGVPPDLRLTRPQVHVGILPQRYSILTPTEEAFRAPDGSLGQPGEDFPAGILMGSIFRRLVLAWAFQDLNLLISGEVGPQSRLVHRRDVGARVRALAPFLYFPERPYAVVENGRFYWIVEGFTTSTQYPLSVSHLVAPRVRVNYLRNSVRAVVDAVTGETRFYSVDPDDAVLRGWRAVFPGLIQGVDEAPDALVGHFRYSRWHMERQVEVLLRYHQTDPGVFHGQQDRWAVPMEVPDASGAIPYRPHHAFLTLPGEEEESWTVSTVLIPAGRQNLASFLVGRWSRERGGELLLWDVPQEDQVAGPRQVSALVEQDPVIAEQFSLWRRGGSDVSTGHLYLVPVGNTLLYMEPVFLAAESNPIPEIRRYIVSDGRRVAMEPTLQGAILALRTGERSRLERMAQMEEAELADEVETTVREVPGAGEALRLLEDVESRLRQGDWVGFGRGLEQLRELLQRQATAIPPG